MVASSLPLHSTSCPRETGILRPAPGIAHRDAGFTESLSAKLTAELPRRNIVVLDEEPVEVAGIGEA